MKKIFNSKISVYVHRTKRMVENNKTTFQKGERPRIEVNIPGIKNEFMYADEFAKFIIDNFKYKNDKN